MVMKWVLAGYLCMYAFNKPEIIRMSLQVDERVE